MRRTRLGRPRLEVLVRVQASVPVRYAPARATCGFTFDGLRGAPDEALLAWFTDNDGFRWQLDETST